MTNSLATILFGGAPVGRGLRLDGTAELGGRTEITSYTREYTNTGVSIIPIQVRSLPGRSRGKGGKQAHRKTGVRAIRRAAGKL